jgi:uncharacterized protein (TIGR00725 family)
VTVATPYVAVCGAGEAGAALADDAQAVGRGLAEAGAVLVCGGLGGVMEEACRGAREAGGLTVGLLPGDSRDAGNPWLSVAVATGLGELRNGLVVRASDAVIAVGGGAGTLSEIGFALKLGRPVVGLGTWALAPPGGSPLDGFEAVGDPGVAVERAVALSAG